MSDPPPGPPAPNSTNAYWPIEVTDDGNVTDVRSSQWNAKSPIEVTDDGMVSDVRSL